MKSRIAIAQVFMSKYWTGLWMKKKIKNGERETL